MSSIITTQGYSLITSKQAAGEPLVISKFILANKPGVNPLNNIPTDEAIPNGYVVYEHAPTKAASVDPDKVIYSLFMDSTVGDFDFNWIGLVVDDNGTDKLLAVAWVPTQYKRKTIAGTQQGNNLTRNFAILFSGASQLTGVTIPAESWQYDFIPEIRTLQFNQVVTTGIALKNKLEIMQLKDAVAALQG